MLNFLPTVYFQLKDSSRWQKAHPYLGVIVTAFCIINVSIIKPCFSHFIIYVKMKTKKW